MTRAATLRQIAAGATLVALVGAVVSWISLSDNDTRTWRHWQKRLPQEIAAARAAGVWTSVAEINEPARPPATAAFQTLSTDLKATGVQSGLIWQWPLRYDRGGSERSAVLAEMAKVKPLIPRFRAAINDEPIDWPPPNPDASERINEAQQAAVVVMANAIVEAKQGRFTELVPAFRASERMSRAMARSGYMSGVINSDALRKRASGYLVELAYAPATPPDLVERLAATLDPISMNWKMAYRYIALRPRTANRAYLTRPRWRLGDFGQLPKIIDWHSFMDAPQSAIDEAARAKQIHYIAKGWPLLDLPEREIAQSFDKSRIFFTQKDLAWPSEKFGTYWLPANVAAHLNSEAHVAVRVAAAKNFLHLRRTSRLPSTLAADSPHDPWNDEALQYNTTGQDFTIWSVGLSGDGSHAKRTKLIFESAKLRQSFVDRAKNSKGKSQVPFTWSSGVAGS